MKKIILLLILISASIQFCFSQKERLPLPSYPDYKNPGYSMCMSMILPGLGQFYNRDYTKGFCLVGATAVSSMIIGFSSEPGIECTGIALLVATWVYSVIDAPLTSRLKNKRNGVAFMIAPNIGKDIFKNTPNYGAKLAIVF